MWRSRCSATATAMPCISVSGTARSSAATRSSSRRPRLPALPEGLAERMGRSAVEGALAAGYTGVGTFEFLLAPDGSYSFMEVNCRI